MNHLQKFLLSACLFLFFNIDAQYVVKKDTISGTEIKFSLDERISDALDKIENNCNRTSSNSSSPNFVAPPKAPVKILVPNRELTKAEICRKNPKMMGYKIQIVVVKSNDDARKVSTEFRNNFRSLKVETDASLRPNYKILVGSYFTKQSAKGDLQSIKRLYPSAIVIPYAIFCDEAK